jgi:hypothetical protein
VARLWFDADPHPALAAREALGQLVVAIDEFTGMFALEALGGDAFAVHEDVENPVALAAPVRRTQHQGLAAHRDVEL